MALSGVARGGRKALSALAAVAVLLGVLGAPSEAQAQACSVGIASGSGGSVDNGATINVPIQLTNCQAFKSSTAVNVRLRVPYWITTPTFGGTNNTHIASPQPREESSGGPAATNPAGRTGWRSFWDFLPADVSGDGSNSIVNIPIRIAGGDPTGDSLDTVTSGNQFVFQIVNAIQGGIFGVGVVEDRELGSATAGVPAGIDTSGLVSISGTQGRVRLFNAAGGQVTGGFGAGGYAVRSNTYTINSGGALAAATLVLTAEDDAGTVRTQFREGETVHLRAVATQPDSETGVSYTSSWLQRFGLDPSAAEVVGSTVTITDDDASNFDASFTAPGVSGTPGSAGTMYLHITVRGSKATFTSSPLFQAATSITIDTSLGPVQTTLAAPTLTPRAEDTSGATQTSFNTGAAVNLRASATQSDGETGVAYTSRWEQVDGPGAGASVVTVGAVTITDADDSNFDASFTAPNVAGTLYFRITANGSKTGFDDSPESSATTTITITITLPTLAAPTIVGSVTDADGNAQTSFETGATVNLGATATQSDSETGVAYTTRWEQVDGPGAGASVVTAGAVALTDADASDFDASFTAPAAGTLYFRAAASGSKSGFTDSPEGVSPALTITITTPTPLPDVVVTVSDISAPEGTLSGDPAMLTAGTVNISGSASVPGHADAVINYRWRQVDSADVATASEVSSGPTFVGAITHADNASADASFTAPDVSTQTAYYFRLTGEATKTLFGGSDGSAILTVTINDVEPPTASIAVESAAITRQVPGSLPEDDFRIRVTQGDTTDLATSGLLTVSASDPDSDTVTCAWTVMGGGRGVGVNDIAGVTLSDASSCTPSVDWPATVRGNYVSPYNFELTVTDSNGLMGSASVSWAVINPRNPRALLSPASQEVSPGASVTLSGTRSQSASHDDGLLAGFGGAGLAIPAGTGYRWAQTASASSDTPLTSTDMGYVLDGVDTTQDMLTFTAPSAIGTTLYLLLTITDPINDAIDTTRATVTVTTLFTLAITGGGATVAEGAAPAAYTATLTAMGSATRSEAVVVTWAVANTSATDDNDAEPADFCDASGTPFGALQTGMVTLDTSTNTMNFDLPQICDDALLEGAETFDVSFSVTGESLSSFDSSGAATAVSITDGDSATVSIARTDSDGFEEGGTGVAETAVFTVTIAGATTTEDAEITFGIGGDVVTGDYSSVPAAPPLTISGGTATGTITVTANDDNEIEDTEDLTVTLSGASSAGNISVGSPASATAALSDDDDRTVRVVLDDDDGTTEGASGTAGQATFRFSMGGTLPESVTVTYDIGGENITPAELGLTSLTDRTIEIPANQTSVLGGPRAAADSLLEGTEALTVTITGVTTAAAITPVVASDGGQMATANISDADSVVATLSGGGSVAEGSDAVVTVTLSGATTTAAVVVNYAIAADSDGATANATLTDDYTDADGGSITIAPGDSSGTITINTVNDNLNEPGEVFVVSVADSQVTSNGTVTAAGSPQTFTIADNDDITYSVARQGSNATVGEGGGTTVFFTVRLSGGRLPADASVVATVVGDVDTDDFTITSPASNTASTTVMLSPSGTDAFDLVNIRINNDSINEADETLTLRIAAPTFANSGGLTPGATEAGVTIEANDPLTVSINPPAGNVEEGSDAVFTVTLSAESAGDATVAFMASIPTQSASTDADGNTASNDAGNPDFTLSEPTASPLVIPAGDTSDDIAIAVNLDGLAESSEDLVVTISSVTLGAGGGMASVNSASASATSTIPTNIASTYVVRFASGTPAAIAETATANTITVELVGTDTFTGIVEVDWSFAAGDTVAADFTGGLPSGAILGFTNANRSRTFSITPASDMLAEGGSAGGEIFTLSLAANASLNAARRTMLGGVDITTAPRSITITDDDQIDLTVTPSGPSLAEDGGTVTYTVAFSGVTSTADVMVPFTIEDPGAGTAAGANDYDITMPGGIDVADTGGTLTIPMGMSSGTIVITSTADMLLEGDEGFRLTLGTLSGGGGAAPTSTYTPSDVTITDAATAATVMASIARTDSDGFTEGGIGVAGTAVFTVTVDGAELSADATVDFAVSGADTNDYTVNPTGGTLTINPVNGATTATADITVTASSDNRNEGNETITVTISNPATASGTIGLGTATATADIADAAGDAIEVAIARVGTGDVAEDGTVDFAVSLSGGVRTADVVVPFEVTGLEEGEFDITMPAPAPAQTATMHTVTFVVDGSEAATDSLTIRIDLLDDDLNEADETLTLTGTAPGATGLRTAAGVIAYATGGETDSVTVTDDDAIAVTIADATDITEGDTAEFMVTLDHASATDVTVGYTVTASGGTPPPFTDADSGSLTITALAITGSIRITADATSSIDSGTRTITVALGTHTAAGAISGSGSQDVEVSYVTFARNFEVAVDTGAGKTTDRDGTLTGVQVDEGDTVYFSVTLMGTAPEAGNDSTVTWAVSGATGDTTATGAALTFTNANYMMAQEVTFLVTDDDVNEAAESIGVALSGAMGGGGAGTGITTPAADVTISASDPVTYSVGDPATAVTEGDSGTVTMSFPVTLSGATGGSEAEITLSYTLGGDATGGTDYETPSPLTVTVPVNVTTANIDISVNGDNLNEADEDIIVTLDTPPVVGAGGGTAMRAAALADYMGTGMIADDDAITVSVTAGTATVNEGESATFTVTLDHASATEVRVPWTVNELSDMAVIGDTGDTLTFAAETTALTQNIVVPIGSSATLDDTSMAETLTVTLGTLAGGHGTLTGTGATATATVNWVTAAHSLAFTSPTASIVEGESATYTVTRTGPAITGSIVVSWTYAAGTTDPAAAADFAGGAVPAGGMLTFTGSETEETFEIVTMQDTASEPDESFTLGLTADSAVLTSEGGVALPADLGVVIGESDQAVTLSVTAPGSALTEGTAADFAVSFPESVTTTAPVTVNWAISFPAGTDAAAAADFAAGMMNGTASIAAGAMSVNVAITALADSLNEAEERFIVTLSAPAGGGAIAAPVLAAAPSADATIAASDPITVSVAAGTATVNEGESATFTVTLDHASAAAVMVPWTVNELSDMAVIGDTGDTLTFAAETAMLTQDIVVPIGSSATLIDTSPAETLTVTLGTLAGGHGTLTGAGATATATVNWVSFARSFAVAVDDAATTEGDTATFTVTLSGDAPEAGTPATVSWTLSGDAVVADYTAPGGGASGVLTFDSIGDQAVAVAIAADNLNEAAETLTLTLSGATGGGGTGTGIATASDSTTIAASDPITYSVGDATAVTEGDSGMVTMSFPVTLAGASGGLAAGITLSYTLGGSATGGGTDYNDPSGTVTVAAGVTTTASIDIEVTGDDLNEVAETIEVTLSDMQTVAAGGGTAMRAAALADYTGTGMITDDDAIAVTIADATDITEGDTAEFMVTLDHASATDVTVGYMVTASGSPAPPFTDADSGSLTITAPATTGSIRITAGATSSIDSGTRTITVALGTHTAAGAISGSGSQDVEVSYITFARNFEVAVDTGAGKTTDRDGTLTGVQVDEGDTVYFRVTLMGTAPEAGNDSTVTWAVSGATGDTTATGAALTFTNTNYMTAQEVTFLVTDDDVNEAAESIGVALSGAMGGGGAGTGITAPAADVTISASDPVTYSVGDPAAAVPEGDSGTATMSFPVTLSGAAGGSEAEITLSYTLGGEATGGTDYETPSPLTVTVPVNVTTANLDITVTGDNLNEADETIVVTLGDTPAVGAGGGTAMRAAALADYTGTGTIGDDDAITVSVGAGTATVSEGESATFTVALDHASAMEVRVPWTVNELSDMAVIDDTGDMLTFAAETTMRTQNIVVPIGSSATLIDTSPAETLTVTLGTLAGGHGTLTGTGATATATVNWVSFARSFAVAVDDAATTESDTATFTVTLTGTPPDAGNSATVSWTLSGDAVVADYTAPGGGASGVLTFDSIGAQTVAVAIATDNLNEAAETLTLTLSGATGGGGTGTGITTASDSTTIAASDPITYSVGNATAVTEGDSGMVTMSFPVTLAGASGGLAADITIPFILGGTATVVTDYNAPSGTVTVAAGVTTTASIDIEVTGDDLNEAAETIEVTLSDMQIVAAGGGTAMRAAALADYTGTGMITDDDAIAVTIADATNITEGSTAEFMVTLDHASATDVTVGYTVTTSGGTAPPVTDADSGSLTITAPATTGSIRITAGATSSIDSGTRTITVALGTHTAAGAISGSGSQDVEVSYITFARNFMVAVDTGAGKTTDRDGTLTGVQVNEGDTVYFSVTLMGTAPEAGNDSTVTWAVSGATGDTTATGAALTFTNANYMTAQEVTFLVTDDDVNEAAESIGVALSGAMGGGGAGTGITTPAADVTISASDPVTYSVGNPAAAVPEGDSGTVTMSFPVTLSGATGGSAAAIEIPYTLSGEATGGTDYETPSPLTVTVPATMTTANLDISVNGDNLNEADETIVVTLGDTPAVGAGGGTAMRAAAMADYMGTGTITDDDAITVSVTAGTATVSEGGSATFTVSLSNASAMEVRVPWTVNELSDMAVIDDTGDTLTFAAETAMRTQNIVVPIGDSATLIDTSPAETLTVTLGTLAGGHGTLTGTGATAMATVNWVSFARSFAVAVDNAATTEGATATFTVTLAGTPPQAGNPATVSWTLSGDAVVADYTAPGGGASGVLTFDSIGDQPVAVAIATDNLNEAAETLTLTLSGAAGGGGTGTGITTASASTTIDASDPITYSIGDATAVTEGDSGMVTMSFPVTLAGASGGLAAGITLSYTLGGSATGGGTDYNTPSGTVTVAAGVTTTASIDIEVIGDDLNEVAETIEVTLSDMQTVAAGGGTAMRAADSADYTGTGMITDDDAIAVTIADATNITEGDTAEFMVTLDHASATDVTVGYMVTASGSPAPPFTDAASGSLTITAPATTGSIRITADATNSINSGTRTITVALGTHTAAGAISGSGSQDVEVSYVTFARNFEVAVDDAATTEGDTATFTIGFAAGSTAPESGNSATVTWTLSGVEASDYTSPSSATGSLTFTDVNWTTDQTVSVVIAADNLNEGAETLALTLSNAAGGGGLGSGITTPTAEATIGASDPVTYSVGDPAAAVTEGNSGTVTMSFPVTLSGATGGSAAAIEIPYTLGGDAIGGTDYETPSSLTVTVPATMTTANLDITVNGDNLNEADETIVVTLGDTPAVGAGGGAAMRAAAQADYTGTGTITDDDAITVSVTAVTATVSEGESATFTVMLSNASATEVRVPWTVNELSDMAVIDDTGDTLTFAAETTTLTQDIVVPIGSSQTLDDTSSSERLTVTLGTLAGGHGTLTGTGATAMATVSWVTAAHTIAFSSPPTSVAEGASATFTVTRTGPAITGIPIVVSWAVVAGSAMDDDFAGGALPGGMVTFTGSETMQSFVVATQDDNRSEMSETFTVGLSASSEVLNSNGGVAPGAATGAISITDNDTIRVSLTGPATVAENAPATYTVTLSAAPTVPVTMTWTVAAGAPSGDVIAAAAADFMDSVFPTGMLSFGVGVTSQSLSFTTTEGPVIDGSTDNTPDRAFTIALSAITGGGGTMMPMVPPAAFTVTIREDDPVARTERTERMEQAATALNRATVALSVPVIARRFDPGRGLANPGLTLNLGGKPVLSPAGGGAASGGGGAGAGGYAATGGYAAPGGYAAIGLPKSVIPASLPVIPAEAGIQHTNIPAPAGLHQADAGVGALPAPVAGAVLAQTPGGALSAAPAAPPAAGGQGERPSLLGLGALDVGALAELAASQLEGLDSLSPSTESRTLQQLLGNSGFSATSDRGGGRTVSVWGRGSYTSLDGEPEEGGNRYDYDGDSYAFYLGLDGRYGDYLAGVAVGYTVGDLELRTVSGPAAAGAAAGDRSDFESDLVAVYPYASWQPSDRLSVWLLGGYGQGELEIEERRGGAVGKATSDTDLWLGAAGLSWRRPVADVDMLLRLSGTALHGETDGGTLRFGGAIMDETYSETETDAQQLRGEMELGRVFGFEDGGRLRPYLTAGVSYDFGDGARDAATGEFGTGLQLHWPRLGLETELEFQARLSSKDDRDYREYTGTGTLRYDLGGDRRGLQLALRPTFGLARGSGLDGADGLGASLDGGAFGGVSSSLGGASSSLTGGGFGSGLGLHSELSYGIGNVRALGLPGLLTLYGTGGLSAGAGRDLYRGGVRFEAARFTLDAGLRHAGGGGDSDTGVLLDGTLRF